MPVRELPRRPGIADADARRALAEDVSLLG